MAVKLVDTPKEIPRTNTKYHPDSFEIIETQQRIRFIEDEYNKAYTHDNSNRERSESAWSMYSGFEHGQWPSDIVKQLKAENRHIGQYNFIRGKIDALAGSIVKNWFDIDFVPTDGQYSDLTRTLKELFYSDKEMMDWNDEYLQAVWDGLIYRGVEQMVINTRYNDIGNIGFERVLPGHVILDPHWITNSCWHLRKLWKIAYLTPKEVMQTYKHKSDRIRERVELMALRGQEYRVDSGSDTIPRFNLENIYGTQYRVIEFHHMEKEDKEFEFAIGIDDSPDIRIPVGTVNYKREWLSRNQIDTSNGIIKKKTTIDTYYVSTICPDLDSEQMLEDRKSEIQIGRLPFVVWSAARINGKDSGVVELLEDIQLSINKRESLWEHIISTAATGAMMVDPELVDNDMNKVNDLVTNINKPNYIGTSAPGRIASGRQYFLKVPREAYHGEIDTELRRMSDYMDKISKQTATLDGQNESSHETGILFARKQLQSEIAQTVLLKGLEKYWNEKGEMYLLYAPELYGGTYREFTTSSYNGASQRGKVAVNETLETPGGTRTFNNLKMIPRHKVVVTQSPQGVTIRATERAISAELLRSIGPENLVSRAQLTKNIMGTLDNKDEDREKLMAAADLEYQFAVESLKTQIMGMKVQQMQMAMQIQQPQQMMGGQPGEQGGQPQQAPEQGASPGQEIPLQ